MSFSEEEVQSRFWSSPSQLVDSWSHALTEVAHAVIEKPLMGNLHCHCDL